VSKLFSLRFLIQKVYGSNLIVEILWIFNFIKISAYEITNFSKNGGILKKNYVEIV